MLGRLFGRGSSKSKDDKAAAAAAADPAPPPPQPSWRRVTAVTACSLPVGEGGSSTSFVAVAEAPSHRVTLHAISGAAAAAADAAAVHPPPPSSVDLTATILSSSPQRLPCRGCTPRARQRHQEEQKPCPFCWMALAFAGGTAKSGLLVLVSPASFAILDVARSRTVMVCGAISSVEAGEFEPTRFFTGLACPPALRYVIVGTQVRGGENDDDDDDMSLPPSAVVDEAVATRVVELMADEVDRPVSMAMPSLSAAAADDDGDDENGDANDESAAPTMAVWEARWVRRHAVRMDRDARSRRCFVSRRRSAIDQTVTWPRDHSVAFSLVTDDDDDASGAYEHNKRMVVVASSVVVGGCITAEFQLPGTRAMGRRTDLLLSAGTDAVILAYREEQIGANVVVGWDLSASHASVVGDLAAQYFVKNRADRSTKRTCVVDVRPPSWSMSVDFSTVALRVQVPRRRCRRGPERQPSQPASAAASSSSSSYDAVDCAAGGVAAMAEGPVDGVVVEGTVVLEGAQDVVPVDGGGATDGGQPSSSSSPLAEKQSAPLPPPPVLPTPVEFDEHVARDWRLAALLPIVATSTTPDGSAAPAGLNALLVSSVPSYVPSEDGDSAAATGSSQSRPRQFAAVVVSVERPGRVVPIDETLSVVASALPDDGDTEGGGAVISADRTECHFAQDATDDAAGTTWWWCSAQAEQEGGGAHAPVARVRQGAPHLEWAVPTALPRRSVADSEGGGASSRRGSIADLLRAKPIPRPHEEPSVALLAAIHPVLHRVWAPLPRLAISSQDVEKGIKASRGVGAAFGRVFGGSGDKKKDAPVTYIEANHTMLTEHAGRVAATLAFVESSLPEHDGDDEANAAAAAVPPVRHSTTSAAAAAPRPPAPSAAVVGEPAAPAPRGGFKIPPSSQKKGAPAKEEDFDSWVAKTVAPTLPTDGARAKLLAGTTARDTEPESRLDQYRRNKALKAEMNETKNAMNEAQERLQERGERIDELGERTAEMDQHAGDFAAAAAAYRKQQQNKKWWQL